MAIISKTKVRKVSTLPLHCQKKKHKKTKKKTAFSMKSWLQNLILLIQNIIPWLHATLYLYFSYFFKVWNASLINFFFFQQCKTWHHQMFVCYIRSLLHMPFKWCHIKLFLCWTLTYKFKIFWDHKSEQYSQTISFPIWIITVISYSVPLYPANYITEIFCQPEVFDNWQAKQTEGKKLSWNSYTLFWNHSRLWGLVYCNLVMWTSKGT